MPRIVSFALGARHGRDQDSRYPRFGEVAAHVEVVANELFDATRTLREGKALFVQLKGLISPEAVGVLNRFYDTLVKHEEKFEHAAYLVGLEAATGQIKIAAALLSDRRNDASLDFG